MQQRISEHHQKDEQGRPTGGHTTIVIDERLTEPAHAVVLPWQNGPLRVPAGHDIGGEPLWDSRPANGLFVESLIAAAKGRLDFYQNSPFACRENALAITKLEEALHWLQSRTSRRQSAGIEGTHGVQTGQERGIDARERVAAFGPAANGVQTAG